MRRCIIAAYAELRRLGHFGEQCVRLVMSLMSSEVRRFPALEPSGGWQLADLEDLIQDFLEQRIVPVTTNLLATAHDDASMGRLLRRSIRNWLIDQARATGTGHVRQVLERLLDSSPDFEKVPAGQPGAGQWRLATVPSSGPWSGDLGELIRAARTVPYIRIPKWFSSTRRAPMADRDSLLGVARAVLAVAGGSLDIAQLTHVFVTRFPAALDWAVVPLDPSTDVRHADVLTPEEQVIAQDDELNWAGIAVEIVGVLSPEERTLAPLLDDMAAAQEKLGCGRSKAYHVSKRLKEKLVQLAGDGAEGRAVILEVIRLCGSTTT